MKIRYYLVALTVISLIVAGTVAMRDRTWTRTLEEILITCLNKRGGFTVGDDAFICEATRVGPAK